VPKTVAVGNLIVGKLVGLFVVEEGLVVGNIVMGNGVNGALEGLSVVGAAVVVAVGIAVVVVVVGIAVVIGTAFEGAIVPEQGPTTSHACFHALPYTVESGSYPT
jgi:hypothetical protein